MVTDRPTRWRSVRAWWSSRRGHRPQLDRPYKLAIVAIVPLIAVAVLEPLFLADDMRWLRSEVERSGVFGPLFFPRSATIEWKDRVQGLLLMMGLPVAFCLWHWRDRNVRDQIEEQRNQVENQRKDINLKEFQEIQLRAAGALDENLPGEARRTLQVAAIHQLRPFLRGEYGEGFCRPAWELLRARLATGAAQTGELAISRWVSKGGFSRQANETASYNARRRIEEISAKIGQLRPTEVVAAGRVVVREEAAAIFHRQFPLEGTHFDGVSLRFQELAALNLARAHFVGADLSWAHLENSILRAAHLEGALLLGARLRGANLAKAHLEGARLSGACLEGVDLREAHLAGADLSDAELIGADLSGAHLEGADLRQAHLHGAQLRGTRLEGANLFRAHLDGANLFRARLQSADLSGTDWQNAHLEGALFDDTTSLFEDWDEIAEDPQKAGRALRGQGARHVNDSSNWQSE